MIKSGPVRFFDGKTSARQEAMVELDEAVLRVRGSGGQVLAEWPYSELEELSWDNGVLRLGRSGGADLGRIEVRDNALATVIDDKATLVDRSGLTQRRGRRKVIVWSLAAVASLVLVGVFGMPALATRLAPLIPYGLERRLGQAVDVQIRAMLDNRNLGERFACGGADSEKAGRAALDKLVGKLEQAAALPIPLKVAVVRKPEANAIALPGGHVYVFEGLITKSQSGDEVGGVLAHEIGHVAHRDGTRSLLQAAGVSFLFGMVLGDFVGGGAIVLAAKAVLQMSYSREVEGAADVYAVALMQKAGGDPRALAGILDRIAGAIEPGMKILLNHPETRERIATINALAGAQPRASLLEPAEWAALRQVCAAG